MNTPNLSAKELTALHSIKNFIIKKSRFPSIRELMKNMNYKSPRSAALLIENLIQKNFLRRQKNNKGLILAKDLPHPERNIQTIEVPLVGSVACGAPLLAEQNIEAMISVSLTLANLGHHYFLLRAQGDSMNKAGISEGDLVLVRQQASAENGDRVVALIDDEATIKEFNAYNDVIILKPVSTNKKHKPIIVSENFQIQGVVTAVIPNFL